MAVETTSGPSVRTIPSRRRPRAIRDAWKRVARRIGDFQARALLTLFYFVILAPFALAVRQGSDPLGIKPGAPKGWRPRSNREEDPIRRATSQF